MIKSRCKVLCFALFSTAAISACTKDYAPAADASGEAIYKTVCADCHQFDSNDKIFNLSAEKTNIAYIANKVHEGSLRMPKYPNIQGPALERLSIYILENSSTQ